MREPHNRARGEVVIEIDGRSVELCLTLGALAELEAAFDVISLAELSERLAQLTAGDLIVVLAALTGGGGEPMTVAQLSAAHIEPRAAAAAIAETFQVAFND